MAFSLTDFLNSLSAEVKLKAQRASDRWRDKGFISHSHELWGARLIQYASTLPNGKLKNQLTAIGTFVTLHKELCYEDFIAYFQDQLTENTVLGFLRAFKDKKGVLGRLEQYFRGQYPQIPEEEWRGLLP